MSAVVHHKCLQLSIATCTCSPHVMQLLFCQRADDQSISDLFDSWKKPTPTFGFLSTAKKKDNSALPFLPGNTLAVDESRSSTAHNFRAEIGAVNAVEREREDGNNYRIFKYSFKFKFKFKWLKLRNEAKEKGGGWSYRKRRRERGEERREKGESEQKAADKICRMLHQAEQIWSTVVPGEGVKWRGEKWWLDRGSDESLPSISLIFCQEGEARAIDQRPRDRWGHRRCYSFSLFFFLLWSSWQKCCKSV